MFVMHASQHGLCPNQLPLLSVHVALSSPARFQRFEEAILLEKDLPGEGGRGAGSGDTAAHRGGGGGGGGGAGGGHDRIACKRKAPVRIRAFVVCVKKLRSLRVSCVLSFAVISIAVSFAIISK